MRLSAAMFLAPALLSGCAPQYIERTAVSEADIPVRQAFFAERPEMLDSAFRESCMPPERNVRQVSPDIVQCRIVPSAHAAAYLLLTYDGDLVPPSMVVQKRTQARDGGYLVEMSYFAEVTQKSGAPRRIYEPRRSMDRLLDRLLESTGGTPL